MSGVKFELLNEEVPRQKYRLKGYRLFHEDVPAQTKKHKNHPEKVKPVSKYQRMVEEFLASGVKSVRVVIFKVKPTSVSANLTKWRQRNPQYSDQYKIVQRQGRVYLVRVDEAKPEGNE